MELSSFIPSLFSFLAAAFIFWYLPGQAILGSTNRFFIGWMKIAVSLWIGISLFTGISYSAALANMRWIVLPLTLILAVVGLRHFRHSQLFLQHGWSGPHAFLMCFALLYSLPVITSGWMGSNGLVLRGVNGVDGIWNLALVEEIIHTFPPQHPAIAGVPLRGYHLLYNLLVAEFSRLTSISTVGLHFHFLPVIMSILLVYGIYALSLRFTGGIRHSLWATFFAVAGGSFSFVLPLFFGRSVSFDDAFGITQPFSLLVSPSFALSLLSVVYTWIFLDEYTKHPSVRWALSAGALAGLSVGMKVYAGIILIPIIGWFVLVRLVTKKDWASAIMAVSTGVVTAAVFLPLNASYGFLRYQPLWPPHRVMQGVLDFTQWELKRQTLESMGATLGLVKLEMIAAAIFILGNLGTRLVGLIGLYRIKRNDVTILFSFVIIGCLISFILPMFFLQPIGAFNMIQFFWYFLVFVGLLAGWGWSLMLENVGALWRIIFSLAMIAVTIPSATEKLVSFTGASSVIPREEVTFYGELRRIGNSGDMVLVVPAIDRYTEADIRDWFYRTGATIPAFSGKRAFLGNEVVQFPYDEWIEPRAKLLNIFLLGFNDRLTEGEKQAEALKQLQILQEKYSIDFIVVPYGAQPWFIGRPWLRFVFANAYGTIYQVHGLPE